MSQMIQKRFYICTIFGVCGLFLLSALPLEAGRRTGVYKDPVVLGNHYRTMGRHVTKMSQKLFDLSQDGFLQKPLVVKRPRVFSSFSVTSSEGSPERLRSGRVQAGGTPGLLSVILLFMGLASTAEGADFSCPKDSCCIEVTMLCGGVSQRIGVSDISSCRVQRDQSQTNTGSSSAFPVFSSPSGSQRSTSVSLTLTSSPSEAFTNSGTGSPIPTKTDTAPRAGTIRTLTRSRSGFSGTHTQTRTSSPTSSPSLIPSSFSTRLVSGSAAPSSSSSSTHSSSRITSTKTPTGTSSGSGSRLSSLSRSSTRSSSELLSRSASLTRSVSTTPTISLTYFSADSCLAASPPVNITCADGSFYAGKHPLTGAKLYVVSQDAPSTLTWNDGSSNWVDLPSPMDNCPLLNPDPGAGIRTPVGTAGCSNGTAYTAYLASLTGASPVPYKAAQYCANLTAHGRVGWYLPSINELSVVYTGLGPAPARGFQSAYYWSSSEYSVNSAWFQYFGSGFQYGNFKYVYYRVRCVRS